MGKIKILKRESTQTTKNARREHMENIILVGNEFSKKPTSKRISQFSIYLKLSV